MRDIRTRAESPNPFLPVIMLSAAFTAARFAQARDAGGDEFVAKPFTATALLARIRAVTERPRQFVIAPGCIGPSRRRRVLPSRDPRRGTGETTARVLATRSRASSRAWSRSSDPRPACARLGGQAAPSLLAAVPAA